MGVVIADRTVHTAAICSAALAEDLEHGANDGRAGKSNAQSGLEHAPDKSVDDRVSYIGVVDREKGLHSENANDADTTDREI